MNWSRFFLYVLGRLMFVPYHRRGALARGASQAIPSTSHSSQRLMASPTWRSANICGASSASQMVSERKRPSSMCDGRGLASTGGLRLTAGPSPGDEGTRQGTHARRMYGGRDGAGRSRLDLLHGPTRQLAQRHSSTNVRPTSHSRARSISMIRSPIYD